MKSKARDAIKAYKDEYTSTARRIAVIRANTGYTDEYKQAQVAKLVKEHNARAESLRENAVGAVNDLLKDVKGRRVKDTQVGLEQATQISLITNGIKDGAYSTEMLSDIIKGYQGNRVALASIKGALLSVGDESMSIVAASIPSDNTDRIVRNLEKCTNNLMNVPPVENNDIQDWSAALYRSGSTFDGMIEYIGGMEE